MQNTCNTDTPFSDKIITVEKLKSLLKKTLLSIYSKRLKVQRYYD